MYKETPEGITKDSRSVGVLVSLSEGQVHLQGIDDDDVSDKESWFQGSYLQALDMLVEERIKLCSQTLEHVHAHERRYATRPADEHQVDGDTCSVRDPVLASIESRLRIWLTAGSMPDLQHRKNGSELLELNRVEMMIMSPPINRRHMPAAKFEFDFTGRTVSTMINALTMVRSLAVQTFRRLHRKM
jgi:hypothetical protein